MIRWLEAWRQTDPSANTADRAAVALAQLQFFDFLSLWFCCSAASDPDQVDTPAGPTLTLTPDGPDRVGFSPWPFVETRLNLEVRGRMVPIGRYTPAELRDVPAKSVQLDWQLCPPPPKS
jgi:hypothetical protein